MLREEVAELRAELKRRRAAERNESKYSPSQPRVPRGNPDGGQWTDGGRGASRTLNPTDGANRKPGIDDPRVISDSDPESVRAGDRYAQGNRRGGGTVRINGQTYELTPGQATRLTLAQARAEDAAARVRNIDPEWKPSPSFYQSPDGLIRRYEADAAQAQARINELTRARPVDLLEQEQRGGHTIGEHAGETYDYLKARVRDGARRTLERGDYFYSQSAGSFTSVQSADRLVNSTISENRDKVDQGVRDREPAVVISKRFTSPTGYEAYLARAHAEPVIRDTFGVKVVIYSDPGSARGWRVHTAYPVR
ncbi:MAG TPA: RNase A-like domain-containing protein [Bradyrhizobium sp.]|nr:RNase A-like domain-containing protein [Bradyrhizobium sp.]